MRWGHMTHDRGLTVTLLNKSIILFLKNYQYICQHKYHVNTYTYLMYRKIYVHSFYYFFNAIGNRMQRVIRGFHLFIYLFFVCLSGVFILKCPGMLLLVANNLRAMSVHKTK